MPTALRRLPKSLYAFIFMAKPWMHRTAAQGTKSGDTQEVQGTQPLVSTSSFSPSGRLAAVASVSAATTAVLKVACGAQRPLATNKQIEMHNNLIRDPGFLVLEFTMRSDNP
jgi:hypothetical protein